LLCDSQLFKFWSERSNSLNVLFFEDQLSGEGWLQVVSE